MKKIIRKISTLILISVFSLIMNKEIFADTFYSPSGNKVETFNNYTIVTNETTKLYEFYLDYLGDWPIKVDNRKDLNNIILTYKRLGNYRVRNFRIINKFYSPSGNKVIEFSDYSSLVINEKTNLYEFYPTELGDWHISVNNKKELENVLKTYMEYKYNIVNVNHIIRGLK